MIRLLQDLFSEENTRQDEFRKNLIHALLLLTSAVLIIRYAWVSDDAHIIFRCLDNFEGGLGLTWNPNERVQPYTCPLWTLLLALFYLVTDEGFYTVIAVSVTLSLGAIYLIIRHISGSLFSSILAVAMLLLSRAFIDFSTSGLENPLTHLLIVFYVIRAQKALLPENSTQDFFFATLVLALLIINRMDTVLLLGPAHLYLFFKDSKYLSRIRTALLGGIPVILWFLFALFYYGFFLPNTAYAKLNTGISSFDLFVQGLFYLRNSLFWDPITLSTVILAVIGLFIVPGAKNRFTLLLGAGLLLHLFYVAKVGGDHMSGRFITPVFVLAVCSISAWEIRDRVIQVGLLTVFLILGFIAVDPTFRFYIEKRGKGKDSAGVVDEREFYFFSNSLYKQSRYTTFVNNKLGTRGTQHQRTGVHVFVNSFIGVFGYYAGPTVHIVDPLALTDPLLSRLPMAFGKYWRTGHYGRIVPEGYTEAIEGVGQITDPDLREYYRHLRNIISGSLWRIDRLKDIWHFNLGSYDQLLEKYIRRTIAIKEYWEVSHFRRTTGIPWNEQDNLILNSPGIGIRLPNGRFEAARKNQGKYSISLSGGHIYQLHFMSQGKTLYQTAIDLSNQKEGALFTLDKKVPSEVLNKPVDFIRIIPPSADSKLAFGHFRFETKPHTIPLENLKEGRNGYVFSDQDLDITTQTMLHPKRIRLKVPSNSAFRLTCYRKNKKVWATGVVVDVWDKNQVRNINIPQKVSQNGIDKIRISPRVGASHPKLEYLEAVQ